MSQGQTSCDLNQTYFYSFHPYCVLVVSLMLLAVDVFDRPGASAQKSALFRAESEQTCVTPEVLWSLKRVLGKSLDKESSNGRNSMASVKTDKLSVLT